MFILPRIIYVALALVLLSGGVHSSQRQPATAVPLAVKRSPQESELIGLNLGGTPECEGIEILGVPFKSALVYGRLADLTKVLGDVAVNKSLTLKCSPRCVCGLLGKDCLISGASRGAIVGTPMAPPPGTVMVVFDDHGVRPKPTKTEPHSGVDSMMRLYEGAKKNDQCKAELCSSTAGEMSLSMTCGDVKLKLSSSGKGSASITSGPVTLTIP